MGEITTLLLVTATEGHPRLRTVRNRNTYSIPEGDIDTRTCLDKQACKIFQSVEELEVRNNGRHLYDERVT